jgi:hypothetical protein
VDEMTNYLDDIPFPLYVVWAVRGSAKPESSLIAETRAAPRAKGSPAEDPPTAAPHRRIASRSV